MESLDLFVAHETVQLGIGTPAPTRRALPGDVTEALDAAFAAPSRTGMIWGGRTR